MEAREALRRYHDSVERTLHARSFIRLAEDFQPPGGWGRPGCTQGPLARLRACPGLEVKTPLPWLLGRV